MSLRDQAKGRNCTCRAPGICKNNTETVVLCHTNETRAAAGGMGLKPPDMLGFYACNACHDLADGRVKTNYTIAEKRLMEYQALIRTQRILLDEGKIGEIK